MHARDQRAAAAHAIDHVHVPQRARVVHRRAGEVADQLGQRSVIAGWRQRHVMHLLLDREVRHRLPVRRGVRQAALDHALGEALEARQPLLVEALDRLEVDRRAGQHDAGDHCRVDGPVHVEPHGIPGGHGLEFHRDLLAGRGSAQMKASRLFPTLAGARRCALIRHRGRLSRRVAGRWPSRGRGSGGSFAAATATSGCRANGFPWQARPATSQAAQVCRVPQQPRQRRDSPCDTRCARRCRMPWRSLGDTRRFLRSHNGTASEITRVRKLSGRSSGVRTSTRTPRSSCTSNWIAPRSNRLVSAIASTRRSTSLVSLSCP